MQWVEHGTLAAVLLLGGGHALADTPAYGKVETFQPGKKYNCVPTSDHKAWDCNESGKAGEAPPEAASPRPSPAEAEPPAPAPPAAAPALKSSALPSYLTNAAAGGGQRSAAPAVPPPQPVKAAASNRSAPPAPAAPAAAPLASAPPESKPAPQVPVAPVPKEPGARVAVAPASAAVPQPSPSDFLALPGDQYVIELERAGSADALSEPAVSRGKVYKLYLHQNGSGRWLLVWGAFDSVESARAARDELAAQGLTPGWPRRIAPLQAEARRSSE